MQELKQIAAKLPLSPGVYIMKDATDTVIYVGKAKKLRNRVSQYFQDTASHSLKTRHMVQRIHHFEVIVADSEFEALVLECSLIKQYMPRYNILLKDDQGYPYIRLNMKDKYPSITMVNKVTDDGAEYFGPFGSRGVTADILQAIQLALKLPSCSRKFPNDTGKGRACLHYHMSQCTGWCRGDKTQEEYRLRMEQARQLLMGNYKAVASAVRREMLDASEALNFELAAALRDRLQAVEALGRKQVVTAGAHADMDVIGYYQTETKACFSILHFSGGNLVDKEYEILSAQENTEQAISALVKQYYLLRKFAPKYILLPFGMEDGHLFELLLQQQFSIKTLIRVPQKGEKLRLVEMAANNAREEAERVTGLEERRNAVLSLFGDLIGISTPNRIESFDISNIAGTDIVASMVVFLDGKPRRSEYKRFKLKDMQGQDDYAAMRQVLTRRFTHFKQGDEGFCLAPDVLLIDGGVTHAMTARSVLETLGIQLPVFGVVKDDRHRTRALVTPQGQEIAIDGNQSVFAFVGNIQEETHRFAVGYHRKLRSKRLRYSELDSIPGIGQKRKEILLKAFHSVSAIREAELLHLQQFLPKDAAYAVYQHFHNDKIREDEQ